MATFIRRRLLFGAITIFGVIVVVFFLGRLTGSPALLYLPEGASQQMIDDFNRQNGFDQPLFVQFIDYLVGVIQLDFGESIWQQRPAWVAASSVFPQTLLLAGISVLVSIVIAVVLGSIAARHRFKALDKVITLGSLTASSIPDFWFALVGVLFLAIQLHLVPTSGQSGFTSWILPVLTLSLAPIGVLTQVVRGAMIEALGAGYVQNARARGFRNARLVYRHALRNASLPVITVAGDVAAGMVNGAIIVGTIFAWPGIGTVLVDAVLNRDFAVVQASVFIIGIAVVVLNLIVDALYALADPRIRIS